MTKLQELKKQKEEINRQIDKLENAAREEKKQKNIEEHQKYVGKYYEVINSAKTYKGIIAFKILSLPLDNRENAATCLCVVNDYGDLAIKRKDVWLWHAYTDRMISFASDPKIIDMYKEIDKETFDECFKEMLKRIEEE